MPVPRIAIVGRPNVGKSSLLNMLAGDRVAIVEGTPGVTRDRVSTLVDLEDPKRQGETRTVELTDTGGFGVYVAEGERYNEVGEDLASLTKDIEQQIADGVSTADLILFAIDTQAGITPQDEAIAKMLREQKLGNRERDGKIVPVYIVATKVDGPKWENHAYEFSALGFDEPLMCSAKNNYLRRDMSDRLYKLLPEPTDDETPPDVDLKLAVIGKRNAGKSTLVNALAGSRRVIVSEIAGTTRDSVDVHATIPATKVGGTKEDGDKSVMVIDTAGLRRKKSFQGPIEWYAYDRAQRAIERADAVLLLIDASEKISQVDEQLAMLVQKSFKPVVVVVNKWDLVKDRHNRHGKPIGPGDYVEYLNKELKGLSFAPVAIISALDGTNLFDTIGLAFEMHGQSSERMGTGKLNRVVREIIENRGPSSRLGTMAKIYYVSQVATNPPTIVLVVNEPDLFTPNYQRYIMNRFRERLPFEEVPIKLVIRARTRRDEDKIRAAEQGTDEERYAFDRELLDELPDDPEAYFED
ncbi:MAG: ribosome biogenesis GTPase Der [Planctomycetota bacterium]